MPLPPDDTLPVESTASGSHTQAPDQPSTEEVLAKFQQLGTEAAEEEDEEEDDEDGEGANGAGPSSAGVAGEGSTGDAGKKKKKKKKAKGKASKAVARLKWVIRFLTGIYTDGIGASLRVVRHKI